MFDRFSSVILAVLVLNICQKLTLGGKCLQCASPDLREQWQLTSYPVMIADEQFTPDCDSNVGALNKLVVDCPSACVEMIIPTDDRYVILRGCLETLLGPGYKPNGTIANANADLGDCYYGPAGRNVAIRSADGNTVLAKDIGYVGVHFCVSSDAQAILAEDQCNNVMLLNKMASSYATDGGKAEQFFSTLGPTVARVLCPLASDTTSCIECLSINDNSACQKHTKTLCGGAFCTKTFGKTGSTKFVKRGCSPINPYGFDTDGCTKIYLKKNTLLNDGIDGTAPRTKRDTDLGLDYVAEQCFCTTDKCNGAASLSLAFLTFLSPILIAVRLL